MKVLILFFLLSWSTFSNPLFGPEWTFTNDDLIERSKNFPDEFFTSDFSYLEKWAKVIKKKCLNCRILPQKYLNKITIYLDNDRWIKLGIDYSVLEVNTSPMTIDQLYIYENQLQDLIWDSAKEIGFTPHWRIGGGHIHIDIESAFNSNPLLQRNYLADTFNNPELYMGALSYDYLNAPPLAILSQYIIDQVKNKFLLYDTNKINIQTLIESIKKIFGYSGLIEVHQKYHELSFWTYNTFENRGHRPQTSIKEYILKAKLLKHRIDYLKSIKTTLPLNIPNYSNLITVNKSQGIYSYHTNLKRSFILDKFKKYVTEIGLRWEEYLDIVTEELKGGIGFPKDSLHRKDCAKITKLLAF